jgi:hypothetical protein
MIKMKVIKSWFSRQVEQELEENYELNELGGSIVIAAFTVLSGLYFLAHQTQSTGFFTTKFGMLEILMLYGFLGFWFVTSASYSIGRINLSRNVDAFGGCIFAAVCIFWLYMAFPFDFAYFADMTPDFLKFLVQWISNDIARVLMVLGFVVHVIFAVYSAIWRVSVLKARSHRNQLHDV